VLVRMAVAAYLIRRHEGPRGERRVLAAAAG
jgi:hypothetical protein